MTVRVVAHNIDEPRDPWDAARALARATIAMEPEVYALQECRGAKRAFIKEFGPDYRVLMSDIFGASLITMVRRDLTIENERYQRMTRGWIGPKLGLRQPPRIHNLTDVTTTDGERVRIYNVHRVWMPKDQNRGLSSVAMFNQPAWREEHRRIRKVGRKPGSRKRAFFCVGDQNNLTIDRSPYSVSRLARELGAEIVSTRAAVDWGFIVGGDAQGRAREKIGSDHPWAYYDVWARR